MPFNLIPIILILGSIVGILIIVARKFPQLVALDVTTIQEEIEEAKKRELLMQRVQRQFGKGWLRFLSLLGPVGLWLKRGQEKFRTLVNRVADKYRLAEMISRKRAASKLTVREKRTALEILLDDADTLRKDKKFDDAEKKYIEAVALAPKSIRAYKGLGKLYFEEDKWDQAEETWKFVEKLSSTDSLAKAFLGRIAKEKGEYEKAAQYFETAAALDDTHVKRWVDLVDVYKLLGRIDDARRAAERAAEVAPTNPLTLDTLIEVSILAGDKEGAAAALAELVAANPENKKIKEFEGRIGGMG